MGLAEKPGVPLPGPAVPGTEYTLHPCECAVADRKARTCPLYLLSVNNATFCTPGHTSKYASCTTCFPHNENQVESNVKELERNLHMEGQRGKHPWLLEGRHTTSSLTELEITQAHQSPYTHCLFYFRDYSFLAPLRMRRVLIVRKITGAGLHFRVSCLAPHPRRGGK